MADQTTTETPKHTKRNIPAADIAMRDLSQTVAKIWVGNPQITLIYTIPADFAKNVSDFDKSLDDRITTGEGRPSITTNLKMLNREASSHVKYLKLYLTDKYGPELAVSYYPQFGIVRRGKRFIFPVDHNSRNQDLKEVLKGIVVHGFQDKRYGLDFWTSLSEEYTAKVEASVSTDGSVSGLVKSKNECKVIVRQILNSLILVIKANYPQTYKQVLREWGFQKEKY